jgi:GNAT superfamily N-acetyltransferase
MTTSTEPFKIREITLFETDPAMSFVFGTWRDSAVGLRTRRIDGTPIENVELARRRALITPIVNNILQDEDTIIDIAEMAYDDGEVKDEYAGFIVYSYHMKVIYYIYVKKMFRGMGLGKALLEQAFDGDLCDIVTAFKSRSDEWTEIAGKHGMVCRDDAV